MLVWVVFPDDESAALQRFCKALAMTFMDRGSSVTGQSHFLASSPHALSTRTVACAQSVPCCTLSKNYCSCQCGSLRTDATSCQQPAMRCQLGWRQSLQRPPCRR